MNIDIIGGKNGINTGFMNPWVDLASSYAPRTINSALELCEFLYVNDSTYRKASERIVNYFLTDLKFSGQSDDERKKFEKLITEDFDLAGSLHFERGEIWQQLGAYSVARTAFEACVGLAPDSELGQQAQARVSQLADRAEVLH